jgi:tetratricopeptide (TPR) repeat protein
VIQELFLHQEDRQREIERLCEGGFPSFGYAVLAGLMAVDGGRFSIVLTTNFDDLVADALYLFTAARPLVIHHESLANFIRPTRTRPLVVKLHGDHRLSPQNTSQETARLKGEIEKQIRTLLHDRALVFLGYGGNDYGIKEMLEGLPPEALPLGVYWLSRREPSCPLHEWLDTREAVWVQAGDFDEAMLLIRDTFGLPHPERVRFDNVFQNYFESYQKLSASLSQLAGATPESAALQEAVRRADEAFENWWAVELAASRLKDSDPDRAQFIYEQGLKQFPQSSPLLGLSAIFLADIRKDYEQAEEHYRRGLEADPQHANLRGIYANFIATSGPSISPKTSCYSLNERSLEGSVSELHPASCTAAIASFSVVA